MEERNKQHNKIYSPDNLEIAKRRLADVMNSCRAHRTKEYNKIFLGEVRIAKSAGSHYF